MKKMTLGNRILAMLLAFVMILTGIAPGTFNARVVKAADATEQRFNISTVKTASYRWQIPFTRIRTAY